jgi:hypothetical protein
VGVRQRIECRARWRGEGVQEREMAPGRVGGRRPWGRMGWAEVGGEANRWDPPVGEWERVRGRVEVGRGCLLGREGRWVGSSWASGKRKEKEGEKEKDWVGRWESRAANGIWAELSWRPASARAKRKGKREEVDLGRKRGGAGLG